MKNILHWVRRPSACIRCAGVSPASGTQASRLPYFFLVLALLFSSCEKDKDTLPKDKILLTTEKYLSPEKTSVSGTTVQWVNGDTVRLYIGGFEDKLPVAISGTNAYVDGWKGSGVIRAYYPSTIIGDAAGAIDAPTVIIPSRYNSTYSGGRQVLALPMVGTAQSGATAVEFKHLTAALMVKLRNDTLSTLTLDSIVVSSRQYLLSGTMELNLLNKENYGAVAQETSDSNAVTVRFSGFTIGTGSIETVQIPIRSIGASDLQIEVYAHCLGDAVSIDGVPAVLTTVIYHYNDTKHVAALGRNVMMAAGIALSAGGHTSTDTVDNALFSVGARKVHFSQGNLKQNGNNWVFNTNQYTSTPADLFPWSTAVSTTVSGWNLLSSAEWAYLLDTTSRSAIRFVKACVIVNDVNVNGLIIFPDNYRHPIDQALVNVNDKGTNFDVNTFTTSQWESMEAAGAIFLPAAGFYNGSSTQEALSKGYYWSSSQGTSGNAKRLFFDADELTTTVDEPQTYGCSVRLVQTVTVAN